MRASPFFARHGATMLIGGAALVAAGAGGAVAQQVIDGSSIAPGTVGARQIADEAVGASEIHARAVGSDQLASGGVTRAKLALGAVGADQLARSAVTPAKLASGAVGTPAIAPKAVTRAKLAADARVPRVVTRFVQHNVPINTQDTILARCADGEVLIGGGFGGVPTTFTAAGTQATVLASRPEPDVQGSTPRAWLVIVDNHSTSLSPAAVYAICAVR